jgi:hypothetical protein
MSDEGEPARDRSPWWRQAATRLTVLGLLVTLFFNTLAVTQGARDAKRSRETEQIGLLTQLNSDATDAEAAINATPAPHKPCNGRSDQSTLNTKDDAALRDAVHDYEYLAWLFNHKRVTVGDARVFFGGRMIDGWRLARRYLGHAELTRVYPELSRFVRETPSENVPRNLTCERG